LNNPQLGARLTDASLRQLVREDNDVQVVVSDGLSADAVHANVGELLPVLLDGLQGRGITVGQPIIARYGRVKLAEHLAECLGPQLTILLIGERPGGDALAAKSLSAYLVFRLSEPNVQAEAARFSGNTGVRFEYSVISNIYSGGLPPVEAGSAIAERACQILSSQAAGNRLESLIKSA
jgi:ethanolamine ammonia-lyase large subunit